MLPLIGQQDQMIYTQSFTNKLNHLQIDFFQPVERWMHISQMKQDEFMEYDAVFHDEHGLEVRIQFIEETKKYGQHPHIELARLVADISSNSQEHNILISQMTPEWVSQTYQADWGLFVDFVPKRSFSNYPNGRILCLYKEGRAIINYIVLYGDQELDQYFAMPLAFIPD